MEDTPLYRVQASSPSHSLSLPLRAWKAEPQLWSCRSEGQKFKINQGRLPRGDVAVVGEAKYTVIFLMPELIPSSSASMTLWWQKSFQKACLLFCLLPLSSPLLWDEVRVVKSYLGGMDTLKMDEAHHYSSFFLEWVVGRYLPASLPLSSSDLKTQQREKVVTQLGGRTQEGQKLWWWCCFNGGRHDRGRRWARQLTFCADITWFPYGDL